MGAEHLKIKTIEYSFPSTESNFLLDGSQIDLTLKHIGKLIQVIFEQIIMLLSFEKALI